MTRIVLHVGPEKCGSSSIQNALAKPSDTLKKQLHFILLRPDTFIALDTPRPAPDAVNAACGVIRDALARHPDKILILSHEAMFKMVDVLVNLSQIARDHADEVTVAAYARRQSDFLVSSYSQWLFRSPERITETAGILRAQGLDPTLFWGVERHLIAAILGG